MTTRLTLIMVLIGVVVMLGCFFVAFRDAKKFQGIERYLHLAGCTLVFYGIVGFLASFVAALGGASWLRSDFEWPVGFASGVVRSGSCYVIPHHPVSRIQLYDLDLKFIRAWAVEAHGGTFAVKVVDPQIIDVFTARGHHHYRYDFSGKLLAAENYPPGDYSKLSDGPTLSLVLHPFPLLWPLTHPICSWGLAAIGGLMLGILEKRKRGAERRKLKITARAPSP